MKYSPKQLARWMNVTVSTVHNWAEKYAEALSEGANDTSGEGRQYTEEDAIVLWTVKSVRDKNMSHGEALMRIVDEGFRIVPTSPPDEPGTIPDELPRSLTEVEALSAKLKIALRQVEELREYNERHKSVIATLEGEINALKDQLKEQRADYMRLIRDVLRDED
jgi:DNA-binding transcriptional MerR regulator